MDSITKILLFILKQEKKRYYQEANYNYITDYPQDLYIYNHKLKTDQPLITYEWFPSYIKTFSRLRLSCLS